MIEEPLDRLNYYNGQRLEASDLKLEQQYHIRVRRWINKSLYTPGIASGLDIRAEVNTRFVVVGPGMALDADGREILLLDEERIFVPGSSSATGSFANPQGLYLTIRYDEEPIQEESNQCAPQSKSGRNGNHASWGGPALLRAKPLFNWSDALPYDSSGEVVVAQVALDSTCTYAIVNPGVRRYVGDASSAKVRQYALEGERDVASVRELDGSGNPIGPPIEVSAQIYFHVRGRQPDAVTLYLRAEKFSPLHYTELGNHSHGLGVSGKLGGPIDAVTGQPSIQTTGESGGSRHTHSDFQASFGGAGSNDHKKMIQLIPYFGPTQNNILVPLSDDPHDSPFQAVITGATDHTHSHDHTHSFNFDPATSGIGPAGISDVAARSGTTAKPVKALTFVDDLKIMIDGHDVTKDIVTQLKNADPTWLANSQDKLGNGTATHPLAAKGTGEIKLDFLPGLSFLEGEHLIELSVTGGGNGGRILYNLYVE